MPQLAPEHSLAASVNGVSNAAQRPIDRVLARCADVRRSGDGYIARCPAHDDRRPSLHINDKPDGKALVWCGAGCPQENVISALGLSPIDLFPPGSRDRRRARVWRGTIPVGPHGRPSLECLGDDVAAALIAEVGRLAHVRGRLDDPALRALAVLAGAAGTTKAGLRIALVAALAEDAA